MKRKFLLDRVIFGPKGIRKAYAAQLLRLKQEALERLRGAPVVLGELGVPFDLDDKRAYRTGDWRATIKAMDRSLSAVEAALMNCTLWNYTADNSNARGDQWNDEDFSIFSRDQQAAPNDIHSGGQAPEAVVRPYARATAGEPLRMSFDIDKREFRFEFRHDPAISAPTKLYVPNYQYPRGYSEVSDGSFEVVREQQTLVYRHTLARPVHTIRLKQRI